MKSVARIFDMTFILQWQLDHADDTFEPQYKIQYRRTGWMAGTIGAPVSRFAPMFRFKVQLTMVDEQSSVVYTNDESDSPMFFHIELQKDNLYQACFSLIRND